MEDSEQEGEDDERYIGPPEPTEQLTRASFIREQNGDDACKKIIQTLGREGPADSKEAHNVLRVQKHFYVEKGLLVRRAYRDAEEVTLPGYEQVEQLEPPVDEVQHEVVVQDQQPAAVAVEEPTDAERRLKLDIQNLKRRQDRQDIRDERRARAIRRCFPEGRVVVPESLVGAVLWTFHGIPLTGHPGRTRTVEMVKRYFYWPGLNEDVRRRVQGCQSCQAREYAKPKFEFPAEEVTASYPWEYCVVDVVGPLTPSRGGNVKLLTVVDVFTR